jgi:hypothetical protein
LQTEMGGPARRRGAVCAIAALVLCHTSIVLFEFKYPGLKTPHSKINPYRAVFALSGVIDEQYASIRPVPPAAGLSGTPRRCNEQGCEWVTMTAHSRIPDLLKRVTANPHFDPAGHHIGRAQMILGLFYKVKKKRALALQHLTEARRILSQFGQTPILGGSIRLLRN